MSHPNSSEGHAPRSWSWRRKLAVTGLVVACSVPAANAWANGRSAHGPDRVVPVADGDRDGRGLPPRWPSGNGWPWPQALHGEIAVMTARGPVTLLQQWGTVCAVTGTTVTVTSLDGYSRTWTFTPGTRVTGPFRPRPHRVPATTSAAPTGLPTATPSGSPTPSVCASATSGGPSVTTVTTTTTVTATAPGSPTDPTTSTTSTTNPTTTTSTSTSTTTPTSTSTTTTSTTTTSPTTTTPTTSTTTPTTSTTTTSTTTPTTSTTTTSTQAPTTGRVAVGQNVQLWGELLAGVPTANHVVVVPDRAPATPSVTPTTETTTPTTETTTPTTETTTETLSPSVTP